MGWGSRLVGDEEWRDLRIKTRRHKAQVLRDKATRRPPWVSCDGSAPTIVWREFLLLLRFFCNLREYKHGQTGSVQRPRKCSMLSWVHKVEVATEIEYHSARINGQLVIVICIYSQCKNRIYQINPKAYCVNYNCTVYPPFTWNILVYILIRSQPHQIGFFYSWKFYSSSPWSIFLLKLSMPGLCVIKPAQSDFDYPRVNTPGCCLHSSPINLHHTETPFSSVLCIEKALTWLQPQI